MYHAHPHIICRQLACRNYCLWVFVENNQTAFFAQTGQNQTGVPSPAERTVNIHTVRSDIQCIHRLVQQYGNMFVFPSFAHNCKSV